MEHYKREQSLEALGKIIHKIVVSAFSIVLLSGLSTGIANGKAEGRKMIEWLNLLPTKIEGWSAAGKDGNYNRDTIFDYMNGGGEMYLAYDFQKLFVREYSKPSSPSIIAEVYQMSSSADAFGIFSNDTGGKATKLGQGALYGGGLLMFWKNDVFVRVYARKETDETNRAVMSLGKRIVESVPENGRLPVILEYLPADGLIAGSVHYFHTQSTLNMLYYLADANVLGLSAKTEAVLARYQVPDHKIRLLLLRYPDTESAQSAYNKFCNAYFSDRPSSAAKARIEKVENEQYVGALHKDGFVVLTFEAQSENTCRKLIEAVEGRLKEIKQ